MSDPQEKRRQQDSRDLEFYSKRMRPSVTDLLRTNASSRKYHEYDRFSAGTDRLKDRRSADGDFWSPTSLLDIYADPRYRADCGNLGRPAGQGGEIPKVDTIVPLLTAVFALIMLGSTGNLGRILQSLAF